VAAAHGKAVKTTDSPAKATGTPAVAEAPKAEPSLEPVNPAAAVAQDEPAPAAKAAALATAPEAVGACRDAMKKRNAKAVSAACESALEADATLARPLLAFAKGQFERGRSDVGAIWARKILQVDGSLADAYLIVGAAEQEARRTSAAKTAYQRYLELAPRGPYANDVRSTLKSL
jgi:tetratricopeptide (TPR) repeat protein